VLAFPSLFPLFRDSVISYMDLLVFVALETERSTPDSSSPGRNFPPATRVEACTLLSYPLARGYVSLCPLTVALGFFLFLFFLKRPRTLAGCILLCLVARCDRITNIRNPDKNAGIYSKRIYYPELAPPVIITIPFPFCKSSPPPNPWLIFLGECSFSSR